MINKIVCKNKIIKISCNENDMENILKISNFFNFNNQVDFVLTINNNLTSNKFIYNSTKNKNILNYEDAIEILFLEYLRLYSKSSIKMQEIKLNNASQI
jgi:hypothetical protein